MSKGIFVTATGTDIGKTFVTSLIVKKLRENSINAGYYKAALSGAKYINGNLIAGDADYVCENSGLDVDPNTLVSYIYETEVSPHLASKIEENFIEIDVLLSDFFEKKQMFDYITVEGSGGIVCPLRMDDTKIMLTDVIKVFELDIIIVASASLGTINNVILTVEYAKQHNIGIKGIILNKYEEDNFLHQDNKKLIEYLTGVQVVACVPLNAVDLQIELQTLEKLYKQI